MIVVVTSIVLFELLISSTVWFGSTAAVKCMIGLVPCVFAIATNRTDAEAPGTRLLASHTKLPALPGVWQLVNVVFSKCENTACEGSVSLV